WYRVESVRGGLYRVLSAIARFILGVVVVFYVRIWSRGLGLGRFALLGWVRAADGRVATGTRCEHVRVRSPSPSMAQDGPGGNPSIRCRKRRCVLRVLKHRVARCSVPGSWRLVTGPCAAGMPRASVQGRIHSVSRDQSPTPWPAQRPKRLSSTSPDHTISPATFISGHPPNPDWHGLI